MLKVAMIGLGTISVIHKHAIKNDTRVTLSAVCDINPELAKDYEGIPFYTDVEQMLKEEDLDCVHICLPHYLHVPIVKLCAEYKVNVLTEKPVSLTYEEATALFGIEEAHGIKIGVCLQNRYNVTTQVLHEVIQGEKYGKLIGCKGIVTWSRTMDYYNQQPWRGKKAEAGGGVMMNQTVHTLDLMQYIAGKVEKITGRIDNFSLKETEIEDTATAYMQFKNGATGVFFGTIAYCGNSAVELEFVCEKARVSMRDNKVHVYYEDETSELLGEDVRLPGSKHYYGASHLDAISTFYTAIIEDTDNYIHVEEAAKVIKMIDKIVLSSQSDTQVVL